jgi:hypothetical protein
MAVEQDAAFVGIIEAGEELHERRLAGAIFSHQRQHLAGVQREAEIAHGPPLRARIDETDVLEHESLTDRMGERKRLCRRMDFGLHIEEGRPCAANTPSRLSLNGAQSDTNPL